VAPDSSFKKRIITVMPRPEPCGHVAFIRYTRKRQRSASHSADLAYRMAQAPADLI